MITKFWALGKKQIRSVCEQLRLCEFWDLAEYSDFEKWHPSYGKEQVWVAAKNG
jgi:hypothetical protein